MTHESLARLKQLEVSVILHTTSMESSVDFIVSVSFGFANAQPKQLEEFPPSFLEIRLLEPWALIGQNEKKAPR